MKPIYRKIIGIILIIAILISMGLYYNGFKEAILGTIISSIIALVLLTKNNQIKWKD